MELLIVLFIVFMIFGSSSKKTKQAEQERQRRIREVRQAQAEQQQTVQDSAAQDVYKRQLLTRSPLDYINSIRKLPQCNPVRLACVRHAASVRPEPCLLYTSRCV